MSDFLELRSNEVHEVMNEIPNSIIRLGSGLIFMGFIFIIVSSYFIKYADVISDVVVIEKNDIDNIKVKEYALKNKETPVIGSMKVTQDNFGRIKIGGEVLLKFVAYPSQEYGTITGKVLDIADVATSEGDYRFEIIILLPKDGKTSLDNTISYRSGLLAQGDIILEKTTLLNKFIDKIFL